MTDENKPPAAPNSSADRRYLFPSVPYAKVGKPVRTDPQPYHLVVVGERRLRVLVCESADELAAMLQDYKGNTEITDLLVFQGRRLEAQVVHQTEVVFSADDAVVDRGSATREEQAIES